MGGARITGVVRDSSGAPVSGAVVAIAGASPPHPDIGAVTDPAGRYRFGGLIPGEYTVVVHAPGHPAASGGTTVAGGEVAQLDFVLE